MLTYYEILRSQLQNVNIFRTIFVFIFIFIYFFLKWLLNLLLDALYCHSPVFNKFFNMISIFFYWVLLCSIVKFNFISIVFEVTLEWTKIEMRENSDISKILMINDEYLLLFCFMELNPVELPKFNVVVFIIQSYRFNPQSVKAESLI